MSINLPEILRLHGLWLAGDLAGSRANLTRANLTYANLTRADLTGTKGLPIVADAAERLQAVAALVLKNTSQLDMADWHSCETVHCIAGWAIHQAGPVGAVLEQVAGPQMAGLLLLGTEAHKHFFDSNENAMQWLKSIYQEAQYNAQV